MSEKIIIDGDLVQVVETVIQRTVSLADWLPTIERRVPVDLPVLPNNTRGVWFDTSDNSLHMMLLMIEVPPEIIPLNKSGTVHNVMIPWTRFVFYCTNRSGLASPAWRLDDYRVFWSKNRYNAPDATDMIRALVPNVYSDGRICFGSTGANANQSIADRLNQTVNEFYRTTFNNDLGIPYPNGWRGFRAWATATIKDPLGWMTWPDFEDYSNYSHWSWDNLIRDWSSSRVSRTADVVTADPIPPLALGASFGRTFEWLNDLTPIQRMRIRQSISEIPEDTTISLPDEEEDEEEF